MKVSGTIANVKRPQTDCGWKQVGGLVKLVKKGEKATRIVDNMIELVLSCQQQGTPCHVIEHLCLCVPVCSCSSVIVCGGKRGRASTKTSTGEWTADKTKTREKTIEAGV